MRAAGHDHIVPAEVCFVRVEEMTPAAGRILAVEPFDVLDGALGHAVGTGDVDFVTEVLTDRGFQSDVAAAMFADWIVLAANRKPFVGVVDSYRVNPV